MKKFIKISLLLLVTLLTLTACGENTEIKVRFSTEGGTRIDAITITKNSVIEDMPDDPTREGYKFLGWYIDENLENLFVETNTITETITLYAKWEKLLVLTYNTNGGNNIPNAYAESGDELTLPTPTKTGYVFLGWYEDENFENAFGTLMPATDKTIYARWEKIPVLTYNTNGGDNINPETHNKYQTLDLPTPVKVGHEFKGWYEDPELLNAFSGTMPEIDTTIYAKWQIYTYEVKFYIDGNLEDTKVVEYGSAVTDPIAIPEKEGFHPGTWDKEFTNVTSDLVINAVYVAKTEYTITFNYSDGSKDTFDVLEGENLENVPELPKISGKVGTWSTYRFGDVQNDINVTAIYEDESVVNTTKENAAWYRTYKVDSKTHYEFASNTTIDFAGQGIAKIEVVNTTTLASGDGSKLVIGNGEGYLVVKMVNTSDRAGYFFARVYHNISEFVVGDNISNFINEKRNMALDALNPGTTLKDPTTENSDFINKVVAPYMVGNANPYYLDLEMSSRINTLSLADVELVFSFYEKLAEDSYQAVAGVATIENNGIIFNNSAVGKTYRIEVRPADRYIQQANTACEPIQFEVKVNDGVNVYNHAELKAAYADLNVETINVHAKIISEYDADQLNADGTPLNYLPHIKEEKLAAGLPVGDVYSRYSALISDNHLVINGNYFTVDASKLLCVKPSDDPQQGGDIAIEPGYYVSNVQIAIFFYQLEDDNALEQENSATFNNLKIIGNTITPEVNYNQEQSLVLNEIELMSRNSGGLLGIQNFAGEVVANNLSIDYAIIGLTSSFLTSNLKAKDTFVGWSWANGAYGSGPISMAFENCYIKNSGGAAIHVDDDNSGQGSIYDPLVVVDDKTVLDNWVSGEEAWFKAYGFGSLATQLKLQLEGGVNNFGATILANKPRFDQATGQTVNVPMFNYMIMSKTVEGLQNLVDNGSQNVYNISGVELARPYNFVSTSPIAQAMGGTFMMPIGVLSQYSAFEATVTQRVMQLVPGFMQQGMTQQQAIEAATAQAMPEVLYQSYRQGSTGYLEVVLSIPTFGTANLITQYNIIG